MDFFNLLGQAADLPSWLFNAPQAVTIPNHLILHPWPMGRPTNFAWYETGIKEEDKGVFNQYARKVVALQHIGRCGVCGGRRNRHRPFWSLGMRVCVLCLRENLVSGRALSRDHNTSLKELIQVDGEDTALIRACELRVFYFMSYTTPRLREDLTLNPIDFMGTRSIQLAFFWRPHLGKLIDLEGRRVSAVKINKAKGTLSAVARALYARTVFLALRSKVRRVFFWPVHAYGSRHASQHGERSVQEFYRTFAHAMGHVELHRMNIEIRPLDDTHFEGMWRLSTRMEQMADRMPEPWETVGNTKYRRV